MASYGNTFFNNVLTNNGRYDLAPAGFIVLIVHAGITVLYLALSGVIKAWRRWSGMHPTAAGAFRLAAAQGNVKHLEVLKTAWHFDIEANVEGFTALHAACVEGQHRSLAWLLDHGANINAQKKDSWSDTALHYAAASGSIECCRLLVSRGANVRARNFAGLKPRDYALCNNHPETVKYLDAVAKQLKDGDLDSAQSVTPVNENLSPGAVFYNVQASEEKDALERATSTADGQVRRRRELNRLCRRGFDGIGTDGTKATRLMHWFRFWAVTSTAMGAIYMFWRATRSLPSNGWIVYGIPMFSIEWLGWLGWIWCVTGLWSTIDRPARFISNMIPEKDLPSVDVFIVTYNEPVDVVEPTTIAALSLNWPAEKLTVYVLHDQRNDVIRNMAMKLDFQCQFKKKSARICYICREKLPGVPHHAKAGNINHTLLKGGVNRGEYVLVLDCDMMVHPDFLQRAMGHLYHQVNGEWKPKPKAGFIQIPQDFWNVESSDPMFHLNTFFFGPMLKGRDGVGSVSCAGTNVIFKRDTLVSIGGQSYGSITEDFNTSMHLLMSGFSTMYLHEPLAFGEAPGDVPSTFKQRLRWAMGAIQVYVRNNPLRIAGLTTVQALLFYDACFSHFTAPLIIFVAIVPVLFMYFGITPIIIPDDQVWEFVLFFLAFYLTNRITMVVAFTDSHTGMHALWRTAQQAVWLSVNHAKAVWQVLRTELPIIKYLSKLEIGFAVTKKDKDNKPSAWKQFLATLRCVWPFILYYLIAGGAFAKVIVFIVQGKTGLRGAFANVAAALWTIITMLLIWPPISTLLPRIFTDNGWKVQWRLPDPTLNTVGTVGTLPPARAATLRPGTVIASTNPEALAALNANERLSDGTPKIDMAAPQPSPRRFAFNVAKAPSRRLSRRGSQRLGVTDPVTQETYPTVNLAGDEHSNFGRVTLGVTREEMLARAPTLMEAGAPMMGTDNNFNEVTALFAGLKKQYSNIGGGESHTPPRRFPTIRHDDASPSTAPPLASVSENEPPLRQLTLGPFSLRVHNTVPTMDTAHNPNISNVQRAELQQVERYPTIQMASQDGSPPQPSIVEAIDAFSQGGHTMQDGAKPQQQQWLSSDAAYTTGGDAFVTFGQGRRVGIPLLQEAMQYAVENAEGDREQAELFAQCLLGGGVANLKRETAPQTQQPLSPMAAVVDIAAAVQRLPQHTGVTVADNIDKLGINTVLAVPDFSARRQPPKGWAFIIVFGTLIFGLVVVGILDAANAF